MSKKHFLEFEQPIAELETKIEELRYVQSESAVDISEEIDRLGKKSLQLTKDIYASLSPWQVTQIARHARPDVHPAWRQAVVLGLVISVPIVVWPWITIQPPTVSARK